MHEINFIDKSFDQEASAIYSISLQVNQSGLVYCLLDESVNTYVLFRKHRFEHVYMPEDLIRNIKETLESDETLQIPYKSVRVMGFTRQSTLVPHHYFDRDRISDYLSFNLAGEVDQHIYSNHLPQAAMYNVFALSADLVSLLKSYFGKATFMNQTTPFLRHILYQENAFRKSAIYLGMNPDFFDIACIGDGKLQLYNTFQYTCESDLLYYLVFVCDQLGFDAHSIPLFLSGELSSMSGYYDMIRQYLPEAKFDEKSGVPAMAPGLRQVGTVRFLNLLNLQMCELSVEHTEAVNLQ